VGPSLRARKPHRRRREGRGRGLHQGLGSVLDPMAGVDDRFRKRPRPMIDSPADTHRDERCWNGMMVLQRGGKLDPAFDTVTRGSSTMSSPFRLLASLTLEVAS
jgi:hypothetical protein